MARARTLWEEGTEPGRLVAVLGVAVLLTAVLVEIVTHGELGWFFDVVFVVVCCAMALRVRPDDFFFVGVLPPLVMLGVFWLLAIASPAVIAEAGDGAVQAIIAGLADHAGSLVSGYTLCLAALAMRQHVLRKRDAPRPHRAAGEVRPNGDQVTRSARDLRHQP